MKISRYFLLAVAAALVYGCGSGGGSATNGNALTQGRAALDQLVQGQQPTNSQSLSNVLKLFQQAVQQQPGSPDAKFGLAVALAGVVAEQAYPGSTGLGQYGSGSAGGLAAVSPGAVEPPAPPDISVKPTDPPPPQTDLGLFWDLNLGATNPLTLLYALGPVTDIRFGLIPMFGYGVDDPTSREQMLTELTTVDQDLQALEGNPSFSTTLPDPSGDGKTLTVGLPELYLFDANVNVMRSQLALSLAYIRSAGTSSDSGGGSGGTGSGVVGGGMGSGGAGSGGGSSSGAAGGAPPGIPMPIWQPAPPQDVDHDGKLSPNEYLPASPYLTLRSASFLSTAQQAISSIAMDETKGIQGVFARPSDGSGGFLIPNSTDLHAALNQVLTQVTPLIAQAAVGPVTVQVPQIVPMGIAEPFAPLGHSGAGTGAQPADMQNGSEAFAESVPVGPPAQITYENVTINLAAWFAKPPADLKAFAPTYPLDASGYPVYSQAVYPDPTFGGLFPNGLPQTLLF